MIDEIRDLALRLLELTRGISPTALFVHLILSFKVDHEFDHNCPVPEAFGGEIEVAVMEKVPVFKEALLLHKPTGVMLSSDLLLAMDKASITHIRVFLPLF